MKKNIILLILFASNIFYSQVGIGTANPDLSSVLDLTSVTKGFLAPRMATLQRNAIANPAQGLIIYNISEECINYYDATALSWKSLCGGGSGSNPTITGLTCTSASQTGNVIAGQPILGATLTVPYTGGNGGAYLAGPSITASGGTVTGLTLTLQAGNLANGAGSLVYTISGTPSGVGTAVFSLAFGGQTCANATLTATADGNITSLTCSTTQNGTLNVGQAASGVTFTVPYTGGNGAVYNAGTGIPSTGVTGLTATLVAGTLNNGSGTLTYNVTGTPSGSGPAYFNLSFGGANCAGATVNVLNSSSSGSAFADNVDFGSITRNVFAVCSDGSILTQGNNLNSMMGTGNTNSTGSGETTAFSVLNFGPTSKAIAVSSGSGHSLFLKDDGTVWGAGSDLRGALGQGTGSTSFATPVQVKNVGGSGFITNVSTIAAGYNSSIVLKSDGTVFSWGQNDRGQLGIGSITDAAYPTQVKGIDGIGFLTNVTAISVSADIPGNGLALRNDGTVAAWGWNNYGELGNATTIDSTTPVIVKGQFGVGNLTNVKAIAASDIANAAVLNDGTVYAWGNNSNGQLGQNSASPTNSSSPLQVKGVGGTGFLSGIIDIKAYKTGFIALKSDGTVYTWGYNLYGESGDNTQTQRNAPVQVVGVGGTGFLTGISFISGGINNVGAIGSSGQVYGWGSNIGNVLAPTVSTYQKTPAVLTNLCTQQ